MQDAIKKARTLLETVGPLGLAEFEYSDGEVTIRFTRDGASHQATPAAPAREAAPTATAPDGAEKAPSAPPPKATAKNLVEIKSPMVGTFYSAPSPEKPPYVNTGDMVEKGQVVCIIEAMKLMNEIKSPARGRIVQVLVENAASIAKDQVVYHLEPA